MLVRNVAQLSREVRQIILLGEPCELRHVVQANIDELACPTSLQPIEEIFG
jgi:hypothetical protein